MLVAMPDRRVDRGSEWIVFAAGQAALPRRSGGSVVARCGLVFVPDEGLHWLLTWILMRRLDVVESRSLKELNGPLNQHLWSSCEESIDSDT